jgi:integrase
MAKVSKRTWDNGKKSAWILRYTVVNKEGKEERKQETFQRKKDADDRLLQIQQELKHGVHIPRANSITVAMVCDDFMKQAEDKLKDGRLSRTQHSHLKSAVDKHIVGRLGKLKLTDLTIPMLEHWYRQMIQEDECAATTARARAYTFRRIEAFAIKRELILKPVVAPFCRELRGIKRLPIRTLEMDQVSALLKEADNFEEPKYGDVRMALMLACFVNIAALCGLRYGEIAGLPLQHIDFEKRIIRVRHSLTTHDEHKAPKTAAGVRDVPMPRKVAFLLAQWIERFYVPNERNLVFRIKNGGPISPSNFHSRHWKPLLRLCGINGPDWPHFHALRHFAASNMIAHHLPITDVASILGHSTFDETLQTYAHPIIGGDRQHAAIERMAETVTNLPAPVVINAAPVTQTALND